MSAKMTIEFMDFWRVLNDFAKSHGLPEVLYREARDYFNDATFR